MGFINKKDIDTYRAVLDISETEVKILLFLVEQEKECRINEIADFCVRDRTTIQKAVKTLFDKELISKKKYASSDISNLKTGWCLKYYLEEDCFNTMKNMFKSVEQEMKEFSKKVVELKTDYLKNQVK